MPEAWGKAVQIRGAIDEKLKRFYSAAAFILNGVFKNSAFSTQFFRAFSRYFSTNPLVFLSLLGPYLSPSSTPPITVTTRYLNSNL